MKTLVIHPNDPTTDFLKEIYSDKKWTVLNTSTSSEYLKEQIQAHDRIVMLGHGTQFGLIGFNTYVIDPSFAPLLRNKECVYIWCNADVFVKKYKLNGFYTGMIISEVEEALMYRISATLKDIDDSNRIFALALRYSLYNGNIVEHVKYLYNGDSAVISFNRNNLYYEHPVVETFNKTLKLYLAI